jgi:hypothetical protein
MTESDISDALEPRPEAVIAGTLSLMSCYAQHPIAPYAERVAANLGLMARDCASADACCECTKALVDLLTALAAHPGVAIDLRLAAGALAIEHRDRALAR